MPELPEVERMASLTREVAQDRVIERVETTEDTIVYSGITHEKFASAVTGRKVTGVGRYGKVFYITLAGDGPCPVLHLGMTGMLQVRGQEPTYYRTKPKDQSQAWPPRFMKFILHFAATSATPASQLAFLDARRLGRIRLCSSPMDEPPISNLGFDPILTMPSIEDFIKSVRKRTCVIKALLLDQSFSAGVGNWVADEILYQARVHPEQRAHELTTTQLNELYRKMVDICHKAVEVNADSSRFPEDWLFKHRWGKGKKAKHTPLLHDGKPVTIKWIKVGGRTSAYVPELQSLSRKMAGNPEESGPLVLSDGDLTPPPDESLSEAKASTKRKPSRSPATKSGSPLMKRVRTSVLQGPNAAEEMQSEEVTLRRSRRNATVQR